MKKAFMGLRLKRLREEQRLTQAALAQRLGISLSYLNQLENNQRPLTVQVLLALNTAFGLDLQVFSEDDEARLISDLREALSDAAFGETIAAVELRELAMNMPAVGRALVPIHRKYRQSIEQAGFLQQQRRFEHVGHRLAHRDDIVGHRKRAEHIHGARGGGADVEFLACQLG